MNETAQDGRIPFSADLVRSKGINLSQQLDILRPFADVLAERVSGMLTELGGVSVKATVVSTTTEKLKPHLQAEPGFDIVCNPDTVRCWNKSDHEFDNLICELCLGGTGGNRTGENADRPATAFDKRLRALVNEKIVRAASDALSEIGEHTGIEIQPRARIAPRKAESTLVCYNVRLLLNIFDSACEYDVYLSFPDCMKLIAGSSALQGENPSSPSELLEKTFFTVEVYLRPDTVDVRQILNLVPGEILKLNVAASTPVDLRLNGQRLTSGILSFDATGGRIRLLDNSVDMQTTDQSHDNISLAVQHGN